MNTPNGEPGTVLAEATGLPPLTYFQMACAFVNAFFGIQPRRRTKQIGAIREQLEAWFSPAEVAAFLACVVLPLDGLKSDLDATEAQIRTPAFRAFLEEPLRTRGLVNIDGEVYLIHRNLLESTAVERGILIARAAGGDEFADRLGVQFEKYVRSLLHHLAGPTNVMSAGDLARHFGIDGGSDFGIRQGELIMPIETKACRQNALSRSAPIRELFSSAVRDYLVKGVAQAAKTNRAINGSGEFEATPFCLIASLDMVYATRPLQYFDDETLVMLRTELGDSTLKEVGVLALDIGELEVALCHAVRRGESLVAVIERCFVQDQHRRPADRPMFISQYLADEVDDDHAEAPQLPEVADQMEALLEGLRDRDVEVGENLGRRP